MAETDHEDAALVARVAKGDDAAFAVSYGRYLPLVVRWSLRKTRNRELAADLASEVFAAALIASRRYDPQQGSGAAWLRLSSRTPNCCIRWGGPL
jgi:RNA polymerase sigma-70 factor, ECF subfamily